MAQVVRAPALDAFGSWFTLWPGITNTNNEIIYLWNKIALKISNSSLLFDKTKGGLI